MADRRSDESPAAPPRPRTEQRPGGDSSRQDPAADQAGQDLTERINAAYASSGPVLPDSPVRPDETDREPRPSGAERFAAVLASTKEKGRPKGRPATTGSPTVAGATSTRRYGPKRPRRARLRLTHIDPWSVMKTAFLLAVALGIVTVVAVAVVWSVLGAAGVWDSIDRTVGDVVGETGNNFRIEDYLGMSRVMGFTMIVAVVDVVLVTVIATLGAFLYNLAAVLLGGIEVVLAEEDD
jgi:hypothetical protein